MFLQRILSSFVGLCLVYSATATPVSAAEFPPEVAAKYEKMVGKAVGHLASAQAEDGSWSGYAGTGVTSLAATSLMRHGRTPSDPVVARAIEYLKTQVKPDGGVYAKGSNHRNYETSLAVMCFTEANTDGRYDALLKGAETFLKQLQWDDDEGHDASSMSYGGQGYGSHNRPDLSNTSFYIDALKALGNGPEDESMQRALVFVSRCQNLETEHNTSPHSAKVEDGGFYYTAAAGGSSQAGETANGGLRSYGSMTYAGLKSMIFAGVDKDDPRVKAAYKWITKNYTLDQNPGIGNAGLFYYYNTFAKALDAMGVETVGGVGAEHHWRADLVNQLASTQHEDGAWVNANERWMESDPNLVTAYSLMALSYAGAQE
jgi:squalene-hopene/tetraprenyl-beta-curcumene cyclase